MVIDQEKTPGIFQLRIYEVAPDKRDVFHHRFRNHAMRIMERYGFEFIARWESTSVVDFEFIYILRWPDAATMDRQWKAFLADEEWIAVKKETAATTGEPVQKVTSRVLGDAAY